jgi:hypothetical protein
MDVQARQRFDFARCAGYAQRERLWESAGLKVSAIRSGVQSVCNSATKS